MKNKQAFTIIELLVAIAIIAVMVGLLFPAIGAVKRAAKQQENNAKVRNIVQGMITYSESRRGFFPGFDGFEFTQVDWDKNNTFDSVGQTVEARCWLLMDGNYMTGDALVSAVETKSPWTHDEMSTDNYSFSMLKLASNTNTDPFSGRSNTDRFRREEWRNEQNALAPLVSDRLTMGPANTMQADTFPDQYASIHDGSIEGEWIGSVGFGDLSVEFVKTPAIDTRFAGFTNSVDTSDVDDIFAQRDTGVGGPDGDKNAAMVYEGALNPVGIFE